MTALLRLFVSGSDRAAQRWMQGQAVAGTQELSLHHLYRTMGFLGEPLCDQPPPDVPAAAKGKAAKTDSRAFDLRTRKNLIEEDLFARRRDLFTDVELVFFDTTSIYFEGEGGQDIGRHGQSKDHRPDLKQMVVGMVLDNAGNPLCSAMWPGNPTDVTSLAPVVKRLRQHFGVQRSPARRRADAGRRSVDMPDRPRRRRQVHRAQRGVRLRRGSQRPDRGRRARGHAPVGRRAAAAGGDRLCAAGQLGLSRFERRAQPAPGRLPYAARRAGARRGRAHLRRLPAAAERRGERAGTLSGGERRLLEIARALMMSPKLLLIDEPSIGLEPRAVAQAFAMLRNFQRVDGTAIALVEQNARQGLAFADRGQVLVAGNVFAGGRGEELLRDPAVGRMLLGQ